MITQKTIADICNKDSINDTDAYTLWNNPKAMTRYLNDDNNKINPAFISSLISLKKVKTEYGGETHYQRAANELKENLRSLILEKKIVTAILNSPSLTNFQKTNLSMFFRNKTFFEKQSNDSALFHEALQYKLDNPPQMEIPKKMYDEVVVDADDFNKQILLYKKMLASRDIKEEEKKAFLCFLSRTDVFDLLKKELLKSGFIDDVLKLFKSTTEEKQKEFLIEQSTNYDLFMRIMKFNINEKKSFPDVKINIPDNMYNGVVTNGNWDDDIKTAFRMANAAKFDSALQIRFKNKTNDFFKKMVVPKELNDVFLKHLLAIYNASDENSRETLNSKPLLWDRLFGSLKNKKAKYDLNNAFSLKLSQLGLVENDAPDSTPNIYNITENFGLKELQRQLERCNKDCGDYNTLIKDLAVKKTLLLTLDVGDSYERTDSQYQGIEDCKKAIAALEKDSTATKQNYFDTNVADQNTTSATTSFYDLLITSCAKRIVSILQINISDENKKILAENIFTFIDAISKLSIFKGKNLHKSLLKDASLSEKEYDLILKSINPSNLFLEKEPPAAFLSSLLKLENANPFASFFSHLDWETNDAEGCVKKMVNDSNKEALLSSINKIDFKGLPEQLKGKSFVNALAVAVVLREETLASDLLEKIKSDNAIMSFLATSAVFKALTTLDNHADLSAQKLRAFRVDHENSHYFGAPQQAVSPGAINIADEHQKQQMAERIKELEAQLKNAKTALENKANELKGANKQLKKIPLLEETLEGVREALKEKNNECSMEKKVIEEHEKTIETLESTKIKLKSQLRALVNQSGAILLEQAATKILMIEQDPFLCSFAPAMRENLNRLMEELSHADLDVVIQAILNPPSAPQLTREDHQEEENAITPPNCQFFKPNAAEKKENGTTIPINDDSYDSEYESESESKVAVAEL